MLSVPVPAFFAVAMKLAVWPASICVDVELAVNCTSYLIGVGERVGVHVRVGAGVDVGRRVLVGRLVEVGQRVEVRRGVGGGRGVNVGGGVRVGGADGCGVSVGPASVPPIVGVN